MPRSERPFSVIVPAHNESAVVARCLRALLCDAPPDAEPEIVVVCNGCTDDTAAVARSVWDGVAVIELPEGSKPLALNAGNAAAVTMPRFFVDADVTASYWDLLAAADCLRGETVLAAAPKLHVAVATASKAVQSYYRVWQTLPYAAEGMIGSGVYGLSKAGLERVGQFPAIISDDGYVRSRFSPRERRSVERRADGSPASFTIFPPLTLPNLVSIEIRRRAGVEELRRLGYLSGSGRDNSNASILSARSASVGILDIGVFVFVKAAARVLLGIGRFLGRGKEWRRDDSSRHSV